MVDEYRCCAPTPYPPLTDPFSCLHLHISLSVWSDWPSMAVWVDKAVRIHEAVILRRVVGRATRDDCSGDEIIYLLTALATECEQNLGGLARIADGFGREVTKPSVRK